MKCTLDSINSGVAYIETLLPIEQTIDALNHSAEMKGKEEGLIEIDAESGILVTNSQKSTIAGHLKTGDANVNININRRSIITGKKI